jgi:predicted acyltransferase (DUF342 family)
VRTNKIQTDGQDLLITDNTLVEGDLFVQEDLTVGGTTKLAELTATEITVNELQANSARMDFIESKLAELENATVSGTLYANNIEANTIQAGAISGLQERLTSQIEATLQEPSLLASLFGDSQQQTDEYLEQLNQELNTEISSTSAALAEIDQHDQDLTIIAENAFVNDYFEVNGNAFIANSLKIGQSLMIGDYTVMGENYLSYQPQLLETEDQNGFTFSIQPAGLGHLSLMAGLMQLDHDGFVSINGNLKVAGVLEVEDDLKAKGTLLTNLIGSNKPGESIQVKLASLESEAASDGASLSGDELLVQKSNFEFINENNTPVASFSANGDLALTGSLRLGQSPQQNQEIASESGTLVDNRSAGQAVLPAGSTEMTIKSNKVEESSMIYITPTNSTNNQVLYVKNKIANGQFTVAIDYALGQDVTFNWWIIQLN